MAKRLSMTALKKENKLYKHFEEIEVVAQGEINVIKVFPFFSPEKVRELVDDAMEFIQNARKENIVINDNEQSDILAYFLIKYFTDVRGFTASKKAKDIYDEYKIVLNAEVFNEIVKIFPEESIEKVYQRVIQVNNASEIITRQFNQYKSTVDSLNLKNKDVLLPH
jgi:hypothetical protein